MLAAPAKPSMAFGGVAAENDVNDGSRAPTMAVLAAHDDANKENEVSAAEGLVVRPESLSLRSPLENLTRKLSFGKGHPSRKLNGRAATPMAFVSATPRKGSLEIMRDGATRDQDKSQQSGQVYTEYTPAHKPSPLQLRIHQGQKLGTGSGPTHNDAASPELSSESHGEPVRFSRHDEPHSFRALKQSRNGSADSHDDDTVSDAHSQLISAFRNSYADYLDSAGRRESSYSWMAGDEGLDSPEDTLDFAQAAMNAAAGAYTGQSKVGQSGLSSFDAQYGEDRRAQTTLSTATAITSASEWENEELAARAQARRSSWDSMEEHAMANLRRIPSTAQNSTLRKGQPAPADQGRESAMSTTDPFAYESYETAEPIRSSQISTSARPGPPAEKHIEQNEHLSKGSPAISATHPSPNVQYAEVATITPSTTDMSTSPNIHVFPLTPQSEYGAHAGVASYYFAEGAQMPMNEHENANRAKSQVSAINYSRPWLPQSSDSAIPSINSEATSTSDLSGAIGHLQPPLASTSRHIQQTLYSPQTPQGSPRQIPYLTPDVSPDTSAIAVSQQTDTAPFSGVVPKGLHPAPFRSFSSEHRTHGVQGLAITHSPQLQHAHSYSHATDSMRSQDGFATDKRTQHSRSASSVMTSAISKHRAQRKAAGLTTEGQYYVDPKTGKHYFVAASGSRIKGKERETEPSHRSRTDEKKPGKERERRKLHKKEPTWVASNIRPISIVPPSDLAPLTPEQQQGSFSLFSQPMIHDVSSSNLYASASGQGEVPPHWKAWNGSPVTSAFDSQPGTRQGSPSWTQPGQQTYQTNNMSPGDFSQEWINIPTPGGSPVAYQRQNREVSDSPKGPSLYPQSSPFQTLTPATASPSARQTHTPGEHGSQRRASVYSQYSYYGEMSVSPVHSTTTSPLPAEKADASRTNQPTLKSEVGRPRTNTESSAEHSSGNSHQAAGLPEIALHRTDTTLTKVSRHASLQLLATSTHNNLTVPKTPSGSKKDQIDWSSMDPEDPLVALHLGINAHEKDDLQESVKLFEKSAKKGCGLGMLMYGLSLRHGWGCESQPEFGFQYLQQAASTVVPNLDRVIAGEVQLTAKEVEEQATRSELVLSIYELGQCYLRGWGITKDKKAALRYFELAADLGDPDAQSELGFCYSTGRGCRKDLKKAAKYYRLAEKQGITSFGMQWIWKSKYDD